MTRFIGAFCVVITIVASAATAALLKDPEHVKPDHAGRPTAGVTIGTPPLAAVGGDSAEGVVRDVEAWVRGELEHEAAEAQALADLARRSAVRSPSGSVGSGDCAALSAELGLPESVLWRESRCSWDAYNATGCGGRGCLGAAQLDAGHFAAVSPWNSGASGACAGLDPSVPADYAECVSRLPSSAWG